MIKRKLFQRYQDRYNMELPRFSGWQPTPMNSVLIQRGWP